MRFIFSTKVLLYVMCLIVLTTILRNINNLRARDFFPIYLFRAKNPEYKYILLWTNPKNVPFVDMGEGRSGFISRNCPYTNCIVTANRSLLPDYRLFDMIAFHGPDVINMDDEDLPKYRLPYQKYVFASIESAENYPLCTNRFDGYFNWTWTYRLNSEVRWGYIVIRNSKGIVIGPNKEMNWLYWFEMKRVSNKVKEQLMNKTKAVAWFVSNCRTKSRREGFVLALQRYLFKYNIDIDIYGNCGQLQCPRERQEECDKMIQEDYHFYLSFENAFSEDYVTEKLLIPLQNKVLPIVYGGADYTRFLPYESHLNARELGIYDLGDRIYELLNDPDQYAEYFKWTNHYTYNRTSESVETNEYCQMCALLNNEKKVAKKSVYKNLRKWWDPPNVFC